MKIKWFEGKGLALIEYVSNVATLEQAITLIQDQNVTKITIMKETPSQYFKRIKKELNNHEN